MTESSEKRLPWLAEFYRFIYRRRTSWPLAARVGKFSLFEQLKFRLYPRLIKRMTATRRHICFPDRLDSFEMELTGVDGSVSLDLILQGEYEPEWAAAFEDWFREADVFIDVGANLGYYSLWAAHRADGPGEIHAFEPFSRTRQKLSDNRRLARKEAQDKIQIHPVAAGRESSVQAVAVSADLGLSSLVPSEAVNVTQPEQIRIEPLDSLLAFKSRKVFVKLDTEGFEWPALQGLRNLWRDNEVRLFFEFTPRFYTRLAPDDSEYPLKFLQWLNEEGFALRVGESQAEMVPLDCISSFLNSFKGVQTHILAEKSPGG